MFADKGSSAGPPAGQWQLLTAHPQDNGSAAGTPAGPQLHFPVFHRTRVRREYAAAAEEEKRKPRTARASTAISQRPRNTADKCTHAGHGRFACPIFSFLPGRGMLGACGGFSGARHQFTLAAPRSSSCPLFSVLGVSSCHCSVGVSLALRSPGVSQGALTLLVNDGGCAVLPNYVGGLELHQDIGRLLCVCVCVCASGW